MFELLIDHLIIADSDFNYKGKNCAQRKVHSILHYAT